MPYIIGTAGHIDHGKTSLIKALTGTDTDRLKEEKERGISIDLGFAYLDLPDGSQAGIVDVPGHERFIRNMLAGAHGMDLVLFTVAADDGVMPQTEEHLDILHLLGVDMAIFLITKADLVPPTRIPDVEEEIRILTLGTALEDAPILSFSAVTGQGLDELRAKIFEMLQNVSQPAPRGYFRLPADRVFILQGRGIIVTGTALTGEVKTGDRVRCLPGDELFRVRSLQVHNKSVDSARWGQRIALNLSGPERTSIERGHVICHEKLSLTTDRFDALLEVRPAATKGIKNHQRVRVHLGTAERFAKLIFLSGKEKVEPKESTSCQVTLAEPLLALRGDHFVVRDETAQRTLGGGTVLDPFAKRHRRNERGLQEKMSFLQGSRLPRFDPDLPRWRQRFCSPGGAYLSFPQSHGTGDPELAGPDQGDPRLLRRRGKGLHHAIEAASLQGKGHEAPAGFPRSPSPGARDGHGRAAHETRPDPLSPSFPRDSGAPHGRKERGLGEGNFLRLPEHRVQLGEEERGVTEKIGRLLGKNPLAPPDLKEIEKSLGVERAKFTEVIRVMERQGQIVRVTTDLYFLKEAIAKVRQALQKHLQERGGSERGCLPRPPELQP